MPYEFRATADGRRLRLESCPECGGAHHYLPFFFVPQTHCQVVCPETGRLVSIIVTIGPALFREEQ